MSHGTGKILVLGIGNVVMSDDGVGVRAIQRLAQSYLFPEAVELLDGGTLGLDLLPKLEAVQQLLVIDAIDAGKAPGTVLRLAGEEVPTTLETRLSPHQMGLKDLLAVASLQDVCPAEMTLLGVQPERIELGLDLSPCVAEALDALVQNVLLELTRWGVEADFNPPADADRSSRGLYWCP